MANSRRHIGFTINLTLNEWDLPKGCRPVLLELQRPMTFEEYSGRKTNDEHFRDNVDQHPVKAVGHCLMISGVLDWSHAQIVVIDPGRYYDWGWTEYLGKRWSFGPDGVAPVANWESYDPEHRYMCLGATSMSDEQIANLIQERSLGGRYNYILNNCYDWARQFSASISLPQIPKRVEFHTMAKEVPQSWVLPISMSEMETRYPVHYRRAPLPQDVGY